MTRVRDGDQGLEFLATTYSPTVRTAVQSAQGPFTAGFGMEPGGSTPLWPPGNPSPDPCKHKVFGIDINTKGAEKCLL